LEQGCHITSRDVTFNAEILHHGGDIIRAQFFFPDQKHMAFITKAHGGQGDSQEKGGT
jgi:hypothetical protein